LTGHYHRNRG